MHVVKTPEDYNGLLSGQSIVEDLVDIQKELSVIVCRNKYGDIKAYEPFEMQFHQNANLVEYLISPARLEAGLKQDAIHLAEKTIKAFKLVGVLAVEMFLDKDDNILVNEVAPRPHNSGHHTIETALTSQ
ncbi:ATP-grasp domain-containing protein, partial [Candidatus Saccharibacteria bacterium]|nr:ATP-grasp domain-containing protein [Candidatus Saccharibacteria bacterium]